MSDPITTALEALRRECLADGTGGALADYIPELSHADPDQFGIVLESHEGDAYAVGDAAAPFTIQSISKPFVLALALEDLGLDAVGARVGAEPSGEPFNAISLEPGHGPARQPDGQRGRDPHHLARRRRVRADRRGPVGVRRAVSWRSTRRSSRPSAAPATATARSRT